MPYSNRRRHNSPSFNKLYIKALSFLVPTLILFTKWFYKKILMSGICPQQKKNPKKRSNDWKAKEVKPHLKSSMSLEKKKKGEDEIYKLLWEILSKKKERRVIHTHTSFAFALPSIPWLFPFLPPFTTPFSINHDYLLDKLYRIFLCFYNIQGVA
jgi:hypothetical protein